MGSIFYISQVILIIWLPTSFHLLNMIFYRSTLNSTQQNIRQDKTKAKVPIIFFLPINYPSFFAGQRLTTGAAGNWIS